MAGRMVTLRLNSLDVIDMIDGLTVRAEAYEKTAEFLESGYIDDDSFVAQEVRDEHEARAIARNFRRTIRSLERQLREQR